MSNEQRLQLMRLLNELRQKDAIEFLAEYLAERVVPVYGNSSFDRAMELSGTFKNELISQINERT